MLNLTGQLLIASPHLTDRSFFRTVVFVIRHEPVGAYGLVLNRPTSVTLADSIEESIGKRPTREDLLYWGGPVQGPLTALHRDPEFGEFDCGHGMFVTTEQEHLIQLIENEHQQAKFFGGYSGWGPNQLDDEMKAGGWLVTDVKAEDFFADDSSLWENTVRRVGRKIFGTLVPKDDAFDPTVN